MIRFFWVFLFGFGFFVFFLFKYFFKEFKKGFRLRLRVIFVRREFENLEVDVLFVDMMVLYIRLLLFVLDGGLLDVLRIRIELVFFLRLSRCFFVILLSCFFFF